MADLIFHQPDPSVNKFQQSIKKMNLKLCIDNNKQDLELSDIGDNEGLFFMLKRDFSQALGLNHKEIISNQKDLEQMKTNFNKIKSCLQERSYNHYDASKIIDHCEIFADSGQLSDYKDCLSGSIYKIWNIEL